MWVGGITILSSMSKSSQDNFHGNNSFEPIIYLQSHNTVCHRIRNFSFKRNGLVEVPICVGVNLIRLHEAKLKNKMQLNSNEDLHVLSVFIT